MPRPKKAPGELGKISTREVGGAYRSRARVRDGVGELHLHEAWRTSFEEAEDAVRVKANQVWAGMFVPLTKVSTTEQLAALWLADIDLRPEGSLEQSSREAYHNRVKNNILPYIGAVPIGSLSAGFIHNLLQRLARERSYSFASVTRKTLSGMLTFSALNGVIDTSPMNDVPKLKNNAPRKKIQLDEDQLLLIIALIRDWEGKQGPGRFGGSKPNVRVMEDFLLITLGTSLRPGEVLGLSLDDVHLLSESAKVSVTGNVNRTKKHKNIRKDHPKGRGQQRTMTVPKYADTVLRRLVASYKPNPDQLLIATKKGTPMSVNYIDRLFREFRNQHRDLLTRIGIDVDLLTPYSLRKTVASVVNEGGGAELAAKVLGHTDSRITKKHYIHELKEVDPEAAHEMERQRRELEAQFEKARAELAEQMKPLKEQLAKLAEIMWTVDLYLGRDETLRLIREGSPAPADTPIAVRQKVLVMAEESLILMGATSTGVTSEDIPEFIDWLIADDANLDRILPEKKGVVVLVPTKVKSRSGNIFEDAYRDAENQRSYWLLRNGERLYLLTVDPELKIFDRVLPRRREFVDVFDQRLFGFGSRRGEPVRPGSEEWFELEKIADAQRRHYMRILMVLEGLIDRTPVWHPLPTAGASFMSLADQDAGKIVLIQDDEESIQLGEGGETFAKWQCRLNSLLRPGLRVAANFNTQAFRELYNDGDRWSRGGHQRIHPANAEYPPSRSMRWPTGSRTCCRRPWAHSSRRLRGSCRSRSRSSCRMTRSTSGSSRYCRRARRTSGSIPSRWRASITGQPVHLQSPLVPAILLLVSLASVNLGDHHRKVLWRAAVVSLVMLGVGMLTGAIPFFVAS